MKTFRKIIKDEMIEMKEKYGDNRKTEIVPDAEEFNPEDFYADEEVVITISTWVISSVLHCMNTSFNPGGE